MPAKVLIVEDELLVAMDMAATIEDLGHVSCGIATTADEALGLAQADAPDVALVDVHLADGKTGPQIGQELAKRGVRVVFVTANPRVLGNGVPGALGVLEKPIDERAVAEVISWLEGVTGVGRPQALRAF